MEYDNNHKIVFTQAITGTSETQVFICPYGQNVRFRLLSVSVYNANGAAQSIKIFDHKTTSAPSDPPAQGDTNAPLLMFGLATVDHEFQAEGTAPPIIFQQGMAVIASGASMFVSVTVEEA